MPLDGEIKEVIEKLGKAHADFKSAVEREMAEIKKTGSADAATKAMVEKLQAELDKQTEAKAAIDKRLDDAEKKLARQDLNRNAGDPDKRAAELKSFNGARAAWAQGPHPQDVGEAELDAYKSGFGRYLRKGHQAFSNEEFKAMSVGGDADGGFLVTPDRTGQIVTRLFDTSPIREIAGQQTIGTDALEGLRDIDEAGAGWVGETTTRGVTTTPQLGSWRIPTHEMFAQPDATQKLLDDSSVDIEAWLAGKVSERFARLENAAFVVGDGVVQPRGFATYPTAATGDASRAWGTLEHVGTGVAGNFAASNPGDVLFDLEAAFKPGYLQNASWVTRRSVIQAVRKFKDTTGQYLWQPGLDRGRPATLIGYPIVMAENMPALAANSLSLALGDFRQGYQIVDRQGIRVLRDPYTAKPFVRFYTTKRTGGDVLQFEAIKFVRFG